MPSFPGTALSGPLMAGSLSPSAQPSDYGTAMLCQRVSIVQNSTNAVSVTMLLPVGSIIFDFLVDTPTAWNSATSATLTVGTAPGGAQYVTGTSVTAAGRAAITYTAAQLTAMGNIGTNTAVVATVTPVGATSAGTSYVTVRYMQTLQPGQGIL